MGRIFYLTTLAVALLAIATGVQAHGFIAGHGFGVHRGFGFHSDIGLGHGLDGGHSVIIIQNGGRFGRPFQRDGFGRRLIIVPQDSRFGHFADHLHRHNFGHGVIIVPHDHRFHRFRDGDDDRGPAVLLDR